MKILVTGANGLVGNSLVREISNSDHIVCGLTRRKNIDNQNFEKSFQSKLISMDPEMWPNFIKDFKPEILISADWEGVLSNKRNHHLQRSNIERITKNAYAALECKVKHFITFGSQAELGSNLIDVTEKSAFNPETEYGLAKTILYNDLKKLFNGTSTSFTWARLFSVYGVGADNSWFINDLVSTIARNEKFTILHGNSEKNYLHVDDVVTAVHYIMNSNMTGIVNIASECSIKLSELASSIGLLLGKSSLIEVKTNQSTPENTMKINVDISRLESLGWISKKQLNDGIRELYLSFM